MSIIQKTYPEDGVSPDRALSGHVADPGRVRQGDNLGREALLAQLQNLTG